MQAAVAAVQCQGQWHPQVARWAGCNSAVVPDSAGREVRIAGVLRWHVEQGFPFASLREQMAGPHWILVLERGDAWVKGDLRNRGQSRSSNAVLEKLALWKSGQPFVRSHGALAMDRLRRTGYFEIAQEGSGLFRAGGRNALHLGVLLVDAPSSSIEGVVVWSGEEGEGWSGNLQAHLRNLWGTARELHLVMEEEGEYRQLDLGWREPWLLGSPLGLEPSVRLRRQDTLWGAEAWEVALTAEPDFLWSTALLLGREQSWEAGVGADVRRDIWWSGLRLRRDSRDHAHLPRRGSLWNTEARWLGETPGATDGVLRWEGALEAVQPLGRSWFLLAQGRGGWLSGDEELREVADAFRIGGAGTMRGFREGQFTASSWSQAGWEVHYRLANQTVLAAFTEATRLQTLRGLRRESHLGYGVGWIQQRRGWNLALWLARNEESPSSEVLVHMRVRSAF